LRVGYYGSTLGKVNPAYNQTLKESLLTTGIGAELALETLFHKPSPFTIGADYCRAPFPKYDPTFERFITIDPAAYINFKLVWPRK
jgi:hypothetical protein